MAQLVQGRFADPGQGWPAPPNSPAAIARVEQNSQVTPEPRLPPAAWLRGLNSPKSNSLTRWWLSQLLGSGDKNKAVRLGFVEAWLGAKQLRSPLSFPQG